MPEYKITNIQVQRGNASSWTSENPTLLDGEIGFERDTNQIKIGNGQDPWNSLSYLTGSGEGGGLTTEQIQDMLNTFIVGGNGISKTYDDASNTLTLSLTGETLTNSEKIKLSNIEDGAQVNPTNNEIVTSINTLLGTTLWQAPLTQEQVQDFIAPALTGGNQTNISVTYNDVNNTFDFFVTGGSGGDGLTQEEIEDLVAGFIINGSGLSKVYDDVTGQLTISLSNEIFTISEKNKLAGIESGASADQTAAEVSYDNSTSGLTAINVKSALDEIVADTTNSIQSDTTGLTGAVQINNYVGITQAGYDAIVSPDPNTSYEIIDAPEYRYIALYLSGEDDDLTTGNGKIRSYCPYAGEIINVYGTIGTAPTGSSIILDVNLNGSTIMTTDKVEIESGETSSETATTQPALTTTSISKGDILTVDVDQIGSTIAGSGFAQVIVEININA